MKRRLVTALIIGIMGLVCAAGAGNIAGESTTAPSSDETPELKAPRSIDPYRITDLLYDGRADSVLKILDSDEYANSSDPMVYLLRARALRDQLDDEDDNKELIKQDIQVIVEQLDRAIALCDAAIDQHASDPIYRYYRGRAHLGRAQMHTLTRSYWSAGRAAGRAKSDLEKFLEHAPNDPDAQGDLGAFLYFADTLPGVMKFFSKLLRFPTGDRERGLELLRFAASNKGVFYVDYQIALTVVDLLFEGKLDSGVRGMRELIDRHRQYTRLVEPFGVLAPLDPLRIREYQRLEDEVIQTRLNMAKATIDWSLINRISVHRAYADMYFRSPTAALESLTEFIDDPVDRPDWLLPLALINRGQLLAKSGRTEEALMDFGRVAASEEMSHFHDLAGKMIKSLNEPWKIVDLEHLEFIGSIYDDNLEMATDGLKEYGRIYGRDVIYYFYLGEIETFRQNLSEAARAYETCLEIEIEGGDQSYQMFASLRLAELAGMENRYDDGKDYVEKSTQYIHVGYLLDFMIHSRKSYYELMENGTLTTPSPLLLRSSGDRPPAPQAVSQ